MSKRFIRPARGQHMRDPYTGRVIPPGGAWVQASKHWDRRILDGDAVEGTEPAPAPKPKSIKRGAAAPEG